MGVKQLLQLEYAKWRNNSVITILALLYFIMLPSIMFLAKEIKDLPDPMNSTQTFFIFPTVWDWLGYAGSWLSFFCLGLIGIFMVVNEVSYKTFRQNIITGMTKKDYFLGKLYAAVAVALAGTFYYAFIVIVTGIIHTKNPSIGYIFDNSWAMSRYFLMTIGYMSLGMFIAFWVRKSGVSVLLYLIYVLMLEPAFKWGVHFKLLDLNHPSVNFYPGNVFEDLTPLPLMRLPDVFMNMKDEIHFNVLLDYQTAIIATVIWIVVLISLSYRGLLRRDM